MKEKKKKNQSRTIRIVNESNVISEEAYAKLSKVISSVFIIDYNLTDKLEKIADN